LIKKYSVLGIVPVLGTCFLEQTATSIFWDWFAGNRM
jgi:hypothetical protein